MSASAKLREMEVGLRPGPWPLDTWIVNPGGVTLATIRNALPQIVAVVEAAERLADSSDDDWFYSGGRAQTMRVLAALNEALS